jgi:hypothetical protein
MCLSRNWKRKIGPRYFNRIAAAEGLQQCLSIFRLAQPLCGCLTSPGFINNGCWTDTRSRPLRHTDPLTFPVPLSSSVGGNGTMRMRKYSESLISQFIPFLVLPINLNNLNCLSAGNAFITKLCRNFRRHILADPYFTQLSYWNTSCCKVYRTAH